MLTRKSLLSLTMLLISAFVPVAGQSADTPHWVHYKWLAGKPALPRKVAVFPVNIEVIEVSAGGVQEEVPDWSKEASQSVVKALSAAIRKQSGLREVGVPRLSRAAAASLDEHIALYKLVVNTASEIGWEHKIRRFDYGIGPGLRAIARRTGADAAILVYGRDYVSTAGRKARAVVGHIPILNIFTGPAPKLGHSFVHIGIVDLQTGDLLWMNSDYREGSTNLRDPDDAARMVNRIFDWYPGIERYRTAYVN